MTGILSYEERVRLERANGLREKDPCEPCNDCGCGSVDEDMKGMTYEELSQTPIRMNAVRPHTKTVVPVPAMTYYPKMVMATDQMAIVNPEGLKEGHYQMIDHNPCDGRNTFPIPRMSNIAIDHTNTTITHGYKVEDTLYDSPQAVASVSFGTTAPTKGAQPSSTNGTAPVTVSTTANGKDAVDITPKTQGDETTEVAEPERGKKKAEEEEATE